IQSTSGCTFCSQRVTRGKRAMIELTFQVASFMFQVSGFKFYDLELETLNLKLERSDQSRQQRSAHRNIIGDDVLMCRVRAVAFNAEAIEYRNPQSSDKVPVGGSADACFTQIEI